MDLSEIIKTFREIHKMTMQEFADRCGLSKGYISMLEKGYQPRSYRKIIPSIDTIVKLSEAMRISPDELVAQLGENQKIFIGPASEDLSQAELVLLSDFRCLNREGQGKVLDYVTDLAASGRYIKNNQPGMVEEYA